MSDLHLLTSLRSDQGGIGGNIGKYLSTLGGPVSKSPLVVLLSAGVQILPLFHRVLNTQVRTCAPSHFLIRMTVSLADLLQAS